MKRPSSPALRLGSAAFVLVTATLFGAAGCGAASSPNAAGFGESKVTSTAMPHEDPPQNLGEAEAQFMAAEQNVFGALGHDKREAQGQFAQPPPGQMQQAPSATTTVAQGSPPPSPAKPSDHAAKEGEDHASATAAADSGAGRSASPCETACRALASMNRAATHICSLAGDTSDSCTNARERVRAATARVRQSCSECSGG